METYFDSSSESEVDVSEKQTIVQLQPPSPISIASLSYKPKKKTQTLKSSINQPENKNDTLMQFRTKLHHR